MATSLSTPCEVCAGQFISKPAVKWCPECEEAYCPECLKHHGIAKATRDHSVIAVENYLKLPPFVLETKHHCSKHGSRFQNYCRSHGTPCCKRCIDTDHKKCFDLPPLDDVIHDAKSSVALADIEERLRSLKSFFSEAIKEKEENLYEIKVKRKTIGNQIRKIRMDINQHLDILERKIMHKLSIQGNRAQKEIEKLARHLKEQSTQIEIFLQSMIPIKQYASNLQTFLSTKEMDRELYIIEKQVEILSEYGNLQRHDISFTQNDKVECSIGALKSFGEIINLYEKTKIIHERTKVNQPQIIPSSSKLIEYKDLVFIKKVTLPRIGYSFMSNITGCVILKNRHLRYSYYYLFGCNNCLILLDDHGREIFVLKRDKLGFIPGDIAVINDITVAITASYPSKSIVIFNIETRKVSQVIELKHPCHAISSFENTIIYSCGKAGLEMRKLETGNAYPLTFGSHDENEYLTVFKNKIYSTDRTSDTVTCYDMEGNVHWRWQNQHEIKKMRGVAVDNNSNVYVTGVESGRIAIISSDGKAFKSFKPEGIERPRTIYYDKSTNKLLICEGNGNVGIYNVTPSYIRDFGHCLKDVRVITLGSNHEERGTYKSVNWTHAEK